MYDICCHGYQTGTLSVARQGLQYSAHVHNYKPFHIQFNEINAFAFISEVYPLFCGATTVSRHASKLKFRAILGGSHMKRIASDRIR